MLRWNGASLRVEPGCRDVPDCAGPRCRIELEQEAGLRNLAGRCAKSERGGVDAALHWGVSPGSRKLAAVPRRIGTVCQCRTK